MRDLHLIEPTLFDQTGHCFSYNSSIINANDNLFNLHIWLDQKGNNLFVNHNCIPHLYFHRRWRRLQKIFLYYKLLRTDSIIYICTAELSDLLTLNWINKIVPIKAKLILHFHQFTLKKKKLITLQKIAQSNPSFYIFTPTTNLTAIFQASGFKNCKTVPCPSFAKNHTSNNSTKKFARVLYAGMARKDKGFPEVVTLVNYIKQIKIDIPFTIQISPAKYGQHDQASQLAIQNLEALSLANLTLYKQTLEQSRYQALFANAICLLLYDNSYYYKFSGILLDAIYAGCPVITVANTWMGNQISKFNAGVVVSDRSPNTVLKAITTIKQNYSFYSNNADHAAIILAKEHDPKNTLLAINSLWPKPD